MIQWATILHTTMIHMITHSHQISSKLLCMTTNPNPNFHTTTMNDDTHSYNPSKFPLSFQFPLSTTTPNTEDYPATTTKATMNLFNATLPPTHEPPTSPWNTDPTTAMMTKTAPTLKTHPGLTTTLPHQHPQI